MGRETATAGGTEVKSAECRVKHSTKATPAISCNSAKTPWAGRLCNCRCSPQRGGGVWPRVKHRLLHSGRCGTRGNVRVSTHPPRGGGGSTGHRHPFVGPRISFAPPGRKRGKNPDPFSSSAFHGFRVGPPCGRAAPPAATIRRPVGAETAYAGRNAGRHSGAGRGILCTGGLRVLAHALARSTIAISSFVRAQQCRVGALHPPLLLCQFASLRVPVLDKIIVIYRIDFIHTRTWNLLDYPLMYQDRHLRIPCHPVSPNLKVGNLRSIFEDKPFNKSSLPRRQVQQCGPNGVILFMRCDQVSSARVGTLGKRRHQEINQPRSKKCN